MPDTESSLIYDIEETWLLLALVVGYLTYYITNVVKKPIFECGNPKLKEFLWRHMPVVDQHYWPLVWCFQGQCHTFLRAIVNRINNVKPVYRREYISTPDGGQIGLDWAVYQYDTDDYTNDDRPIVILMPGIAGSSAEGYAVEMVHSVVNLGYRAVVFNNRGLGGAQLKTPRTFCVTNTDDLRTVVCHVKKLHPRASLMAAGASAGGITLFHYLCNYGEECHLNGAMIVSVLYEMFESNKSLESFPNIAIFNNTLTRCMVEDIIVTNLPMIKQNTFNLDINHILKAKTIRQFHTRFTCPMFGYSDWEDYYRHCMLTGRMHKIRVPTLFLSAGDDPFAPMSSIPIEEMKQQDNVILVATHYGGHYGYLEGIKPKGPGYVDKVFRQYLDAILKHGGTELQVKS